MERISASENDSATEREARTSPRRLNLRVKRICHTKESTLGELSINGTFFCHTLEDTDRKLETRGMAAKLPGITAIPKGKYKLGITFSNRFQKDLPLLYDVPYFTGVRIHTGNNATNTEGCLLVGVKKDRDDFIYDSRKTMQALMVKLEAADGMEVEIC